MAENVSTTSDWKSALAKSTQLLERSSKDRKRASEFLWTGARDAISEWLPNSDDDASGENLYGDVMEALGGTRRKGDASKIKTVALAAKDGVVDINTYPNLSKAYAAAVAATKVARQHEDEDKAAEEAVQSLAESAPKSSSTPEGAAQIVLSKGVDEAARLLLDALGANNTAAHRALLRAITQEIAGRNKPAPKPKAVKAGPKDGATEVTEGTKTAKPKATKAATKAKPKAAPKDGTTKARATVAKSKAKPVATKAKPSTEPEADDMFDMIEDEPSTEQVAAPKPVKGKARPVVRRK